MMLCEECDVLVPQEDVVVSCEDFVVPDGKILGYHSFEG